MNFARRCASILREARRLIREKAGWSRRRRSAIRGMSSRRKRSSIAGEVGYQAAFRREGVEAPPAISRVGSDVFEIARVGEDYVERLPGLRKKIASLSAAGEVGTLATATASHSRGTTQAVPCYAFRNVDLRGVTQKPARLLDREGTVLHPEVHAPPMDRRFDAEGNADRFDHDRPVAGSARPGYETARPNPPWPSRLRAPARPERPTSARR